MAKVMHCRCMAGVQDCRCPAGVQVDRCGAGEQDHRRVVGVQDCERRANGQKIMGALGARDHGCGCAISQGSMSATAALQCLGHGDACGPHPLGGQARPWM